MFGSPALNSPIDNIGLPGMTWHVAVQYVDMNNDPGHGIAQFERLQDVWFYIHGMAQQFQLDTVDIQRIGHRQFMEKDRVS